MLKNITNFSEAKIYIKHLQGQSIFQLTVTRYIGLVGAKEKHNQTQHTFVANTQTCIEYVNNYDKNAIKAAVYFMDMH